MRWKEKCFVNTEPNCGLSIAGFYYVCFNRENSTFEAYYYDNQTTPFQRLELKLDTQDLCGLQFPEYTFK